MISNLAEMAQEALSALESTDMLKDRPGHQLDLGGRKRNANSQYVGLNRRKAEAKCADVN